MKTRMPPDRDICPDCTTVFDVIIVGGGIQGIMLAYEATGLGLRPLLLERGTFGGETTANWFRILHGGLRYLQQLDFGRVRESARERQWFLDNYPQFVKPHPFLMPLYGRGLKRGSAFRGAFLATEALGVGLGARGAGGARVPAGRVIDHSEVMRLFPNVPAHGLKGGALWHDCVVSDTAGLICALVDDASGLGATLVEGVEVRELLVDDERVTGVRAKSVASGENVTFLAPVVINAAGAANARLAELFDRPMPSLFEPVLAFNVLLDCPAPSSIGLSVSPPGENGPMMFSFPDGERTFAGTWYVSPEPGNSNVPESALAAFLEALNASLPGLGAAREHVIEVTKGLLPGRKHGTTDLVQHEIIVDHGRNGGPSGLISVSGVKFTTARSVARKALKRAVHVAK